MQRTMRNIYATRQRYSNLLLKNSFSFYGLSQDGFDINDSYIDDDLLANNANIRLAESSQEVHSPSELDNYFLDPEGLNLIDPFIVNQPSTDEDMVNDGDPEPDQGPFDPG